MLVDIVVSILLVIVIGSAIIYLVKARKKGVKCIGCPSGCNCTSGGKPIDSEPCNCQGCDAEEK